MSPRRVWSRMDRALSTTTARVLAWVVIVGLGAAGLAYVQEDQQRACQDGNQFLQHHLPDALADNNRALGERLVGDQQPDGSYRVAPEAQAQIDDFVHDSRERLRRRFPPRDC